MLKKYSNIKFSNSTIAVIMWYVSSILLSVDVIIFEQGFMKAFIISGIFVGIHSIVKAANV